jgi:putative copper export protein/mono/diheme cytochrome c family protein/peroxiredoxin
MTDLAAVLRFLQLTAAALLAGSFGFMLFVARPACLATAAKAHSDYSSFAWLQLRIARWCAVLILASASLGLWLQTIAVNESAGAGLFDATAVAILLAETQYGAVWILRMVLLLALGALLFLRPAAASNSSAIVAVGFGLSACLLASLSLAGHAAAAEGAAFATQVSFDALHLLASGLWLGGLPLLAALLRRCLRANDLPALAVAAAATRRFSRLALGSVSVLIITGGYNAWNMVGGFGALFGTAYGELLMLKIVLLLPILAIGAINLLWLKPRILGTFSTQPETTKVQLYRLTRNVAGEIVLGLGILLVVGYLGFTPPARHVQPDWPFSFRWDWSLADKSPKVAAEVQRAMIWGAIGGIALMFSLARRRRRIVTATIGLGAAMYSINVIDTAISTDAYPTTYKRPAVAYHAISVANGKQLYRESCVRCHGTGGYGDGPEAPTLAKKPVDLTAAHVNNHTAGDLFWWLTYGIEGTPMPGFRASLSDDERWDVINFLRALSSGEKARALAPVIENEPWLVAPDFTYGLDTGEMKTLKDHRGGKVVLLAFFQARTSQERIARLQSNLPRLRDAGVEVVLVPDDGQAQVRAHHSPAPMVTEGNLEIADTYKLFARSFGDDASVAGAPHVEFLIDKQGYIRARWLPEESDGWKDLDRLFSQVDLLQNEKSRAPAPDDHVH